MAAPTSTHTRSQRGVSNTLAAADYVVETETITEANRAEEVPNQDGAIVNELDYDKRYDLSLTCHSSKASQTAAPATVGAVDFDYAGAKWKVDNVQEAGSYNGLRRWTIAAHRYTGFPKQS